MELSPTAIASATDIDNGIFSGTSDDAVAILLTYDTARRFLLIGAVEVSGKE